MKLLPRLALGVILALSVVLTPLAAAALPPEAPEGYEYQASSARVMMGIGCVQSNPGVCDSTAYWIGDTAGTDVVGTLPGPTTPLNEVTYTVDGVAAYNDDFPADEKFFGREHVLRTDAPLNGQVTIAGYEGVGFGVNTTVDVRIDLQNKTTGKFFSLNATATAHHLPASGDLVLKYSIPLDPAMDGNVVVIDNLNLAVRGVNVLTGFVDGAGGSYFDVPTYKLVEVAPTAEEQV